MATAPAPGASQSPDIARQTRLRNALGKIEQALQAAAGTDPRLLAQLRTLRQRHEQARLQLAILGQFKRGKSTFVNALLGSPVLPTGVVPLTAVSTFISWRPEPFVAVHFKGGPTEEFAVSEASEIRDVLFRFVAEEANPQNRLGVERVELFYPADILATGTVIIDTPGVGSTLSHNTEAAMQVLPECDAAIFVVSADPPITAVEVDFLHHLQSRVSQVFFVLNKVDYLNAAEQRITVDFLQETLDEHSIRNTDRPIFSVSSRAALEAKQSSDKDALERSGILVLEDHLVRALADEKSRWLEQAVQSKSAEILARASAELGLRVRALNMPIEELAQKSHAFQDALRSIEEQRRITRDLLAGDHRRLREALDARVTELRKEIAANVAHVIDAKLAGVVTTGREEAVRHALSAALQTEFEAARGPLVNTFAQETTAALQNSQERVEALVTGVRQTAANIFDIPLGPDLEHQTFELGEDPYWVTEAVRMSLIPDASRLIDRLLPTTIRRRRLRQRMIGQADDLIVRNGENLRWAILRGLDETFRSATAQFEERLDETISATRDVISDALTRRRDQSFAVQPELDRLAAAMSSLRSLREKDLGLGRLDPSRPQEVNASR